MHTNRGGTAFDVDRESFEKSLSASISKAINVTECAVKEKHARIVVIASHKERSATSYWNIVRRLPLQDNPLVSWKFCHVTHKLLRDGHPNVLKDSLHSTSFIADIGRLWGHLKEGYGILIASYTRLIQQKLIFHRKNSLFPGNLVLGDDQLERICNNDINSYFELSVDMLDYMDCILQLQKFVFNSMDMSRSNSMTSSGQCKLAPLIPCIQDSCQLYHFLVQILFKLHSSLPADTLGGHRERFYKQFNTLKQFYVNVKNLQYFKNLIQVPEMPNSSPNFLRASELSSHVKPLALVSEPEDYGVEPDDDNVVSDLVDTTLSKSGSSETTALQTLLHEKNLYIEKLEQELKGLRLEIDRIRKEDRMVLESLHSRIQELEVEIVVQKQIAESTTHENEMLKTAVIGRNNDKSTISEEKFNSIEKLAKANEEKFLKMKDIYGKLREEHVQLLRTNSEASKQLGSEKKENEALQQKYQVMFQEHSESRKEKCKIEEELIKSHCTSEELSSTLLLNKSLQIDKEMLQCKLKVLDDNLKALNEKMDDQEKEIIKYVNELDEEKKEKLEVEKKLIDLQGDKNETLTKLNEAISKQTATHEDLLKYTSDKEELTCTLQSLKQQKVHLENQLELSTTKINELTQSQEKLLEDNVKHEKALREKVDELHIKSQRIEENKIKMEILVKELSECNLAHKASKDEISLLLSKKNDLMQEKEAIESKMNEIVTYVKNTSMKNKGLIEKLVFGCQLMTTNSLSQTDNIHFTAVNCTADYLLENVPPTLHYLQRLDEAVSSCDNGQLEAAKLLSDMIHFSHLISETIQFAFATAHAAPIEAGEELSNLSKRIGENTLELLSSIKPDCFSIEKYLAHSKLLKESLEQITKEATGLLPKIEDIQAEKLDDLVDKEMQQTTKTIEQAASRLAEMIASSRELQSGLQLEVNEKILDSCNNLMKKIRLLIEKSKFLQKEIVAQGRGTSTIKDFYKKHHRWTEGLLSAAKAVGFGANVLVDAADKVVGGKGKFEELVVCAQEIAASTTQLVVASKVKAERGSENLIGLSEASKGVSEATGLVVASAKSGAERIEELDMFDFSKLTLHLAKRKEMDSQVRVLELESLLEKERRKLAELRKTHYQLAGEAEGWETEQQK